MKINGKFVKVCMAGAAQRMDGQVKAYVELSCDGLRYNRNIFTADFPRGEDMDTVYRILSMPFSARRTEMYNFLKPHIEPAVLAWVSGRTL